MRNKLLPLLLFLAAIPFLQRLAIWILEPDYVRCDGDLVKFEIAGHKVEMFRWIK